MITMVDAQLRAEAERFRLRFSCESCVHYAEELASCGNGYPVAPHRNVDLPTRAELLFCKDFELS